MSLYNISSFMLYFIFLFFYELGSFSMNLVIRTWPRYYIWNHVSLDRSWWNLPSICKIELQAHFGCEHFFLFSIFFEKITIYHKLCLSIVHLTSSSSIPFGPFIRRVLVLVPPQYYTYLRILFQHIKRNDNFFNKIGRK